jgi:hypothetical protein
MKFGKVEHGRHLSLLQDGSNKKQIELNCLQIKFFNQYVRLSLVFQTSKCL